MRIHLLHGKGLVAFQRGGPYSPSSLVYRMKYVVCKQNW